MVKTCYVFWITIFLLHLGCSPGKPVDQRCSKGTCSQNSALSGANATFSPFKIPNAPEGQWTMELAESPSPQDVRSGLKRLKISWKPYPSAKTYILSIGLDQGCSSQVKTYEINGIFYDQTYSRDIVIEQGVTYYACLSATIAEAQTVTPQNSPLLLSTESAKTQGFSVVGSRPLQHKGGFKLEWTEPQDAKSYEIALMDSRATLVRAMKDIPAPINNIEIPDVGAGRYFLRLYATLANGLKVKAMMDNKDIAYEFLVDKDPIGSWANLKPTTGEGPGPLTDSATFVTPKGILVWGGSNPDGINQKGAIYDLQSKSWSPISLQNSPEPRIGPTVWTGSQLVTWGGSDFNFKTFKSQRIVGSGASYDPAKDQWNPMPIQGAPSPRMAHSLTAMGEQIFIWGGLDKPSIEDKSIKTLGDGALYNLSTQTWTAIPRRTERAYHCAVWANDRIILWGGIQKNAQGELILLAQGEMFNPKTLEWSVISSEGQPSPRYGHQCAWTGKKMLVWGGSTGFISKGQGALYDPQSNTWTPMEDNHSPLATIGEGSYWTGRYFVVWGGRYNETTLVQVGAAYDPETNKWKFISTDLAPSARWGVQLTGQGDKIYLYGGDSVEPDTNKPGKIYDDLAELTLPP